MKTIDRHRVAHWATDLIEVAAVFFAVGTAHLFVTLLGERAHGAPMLTVSAAILVAGALLRRRWSRRRATFDSQRHAALPDLLAIPAGRQALMRLRTTLPDRPGTLAALSTRLAPSFAHAIEWPRFHGQRGWVGSTWRSCRSWFCR